MEVQSSTTVRQAVASTSDVKLAPASAPVATETAEKAVPTEAAKQVSSDSAPIEKQETPPPKPQSATDVAELAKQLEDAINEVNGTSVRFSVASVKDDSQGLRFQVINKGTGEIVREFPSEEVVKLAEGAKRGDEQGLLVNAPA